MKNYFSEVWRDVRHVMLVLLRIMIPISVAVKLLDMLGVIPWIAVALSPVMGMVGLPGQASIIWAGALLTGLYGGLAAYSGLGPSIVLTTAQVSVLAGMMLIAHAFPLELKIAQKAGVRFRFMLGVRLGGALVFGILTHRILTAFHWLQTPAHSVWTRTVANGWIDWAIGEAQNYVKILVIVSLLLGLLKALEKLGMTEWIVKLLHPGLRSLGISKAATPITIVGLLLGISYGGGLIIKEAKSGKVSIQDVLLTLCLLGLCHSLIEDTVLMTLIGGSLAVVLWGRIAFALVVVVLIRLALTKVSERATKRFVLRRS